MKDFSRSHPAFSLCGLNCALCPMHVGGLCPGCGGGPGNQSCSIARCSRQQGNVEFCSLCGAYPCHKYDGIDAYDSFVPHRHQLRDMERASQIGIDAYLAELAEKTELLDQLLSGYNDGRHKSFFCTAVNLLELEDIKPAMVRLEAAPPTLTLKEKATLAGNLLEEAAAARGLSLKLKKKPATKV